MVLGEISFSESFPALRVGASDGLYECPWQRVIEKEGGECIRGQQTREFGIQGERLSRSARRAPLVFPIPNP